MRLMDSMVLIVARLRMSVTLWIRERKTFTLIAVLGICFLSCFSCMPGDEDEYEDIASYVGTWSGTITTYGVSQPIALTVQQNGVTTGSINFRSGMISCIVSLNGTIYGSATATDARPWPFYAEIQESGCANVKLYLWSSQPGENKISGYATERTPPVVGQNYNMVFTLNRSQKHVIFDYLKKTFLLFFL